MKPKKIGVNLKSGFGQITDKMLVSVIICAYTMERYNDLKEAVESLLNQSYGDLEIILVIDEDEELYRSAKVEFDAKIVFNKERIGLPASRNKGIEVAKGDLIAFFDDDAIADKNWLRELVRMYEDRNAIAAGGKILPLWIGKKPKHFPEEFYWLVGATHKGFSEEVTEVRNTFTSNLSFRADVLAELGGFKSELKAKSGIPMQSEETEICERMRQKFGRRVMYNPNAIVYHKVFLEKLKLGYLLKRNFWQGYSKAIMEKSVGEIEEEKNFLRYLLVNRSLYRLKKGLAGSVEDLKKLMTMWLFTFCVGAGYIHGKISQ